MSSYIQNCASLCVCLGKQKNGYPVCKVIGYNEKWKYADWFKLIALCVSKVVFKPYVVLNERPVWFI